MRGVLKEDVGGRFLDHLSEVHDGDVVGEIFDDGEVMGDEEIGESEFLLEAL